MGIYYLHTADWILRGDSINRTGDPINNFENLFVVLADPDSAGDKILGGMEV